MTVYGTLELPTGRYPLTELDLLTAAKLAHYEGGRTDATQAAAIIWTVAARTGWLDYPSFSEMAYAFAQPLNPRWRASGDMCGPGGQYEGTEHCSPERLERRRQAANATWSDLSATARGAAWAFVHGSLPNIVPGAVDFASGSTADAGERNPNLVALYEKRGQVYFAAKRADDDSRTLKWRIIRVRPKGVVGVLSALGRAFL